MAQLQDTELPGGDAEHTLHLNPAAEFHPLVLLPGDPARAMAIATANLTAPRMFNHRRGLWGYSGKTEDGVGILIQSSGMGGPSAAIVVEELCDLGAEVIVRVGTCGALAPEIKLGELIVATTAIGFDGASLALGGSDELDADPAISERLLERARAGGRQVHDGAIATVDLFYDPDAELRHRQIIERGALGLEMEAAAVFAVAARRGVRAACLLGVTDLLGEAGERARLSHDQIVELGADIGAVAVDAVAAAAN